LDNSDCRLCKQYCKKQYGHRACKKKKQLDDFNAGELIESNDFENMTEEIFKLLIDIASGRQTKNEQNGYRDISIFKDGVIM
jgi:altronate hydrolase